MPATPDERMKKAFAYVDEHLDEMLEEVREVCSHPSVKGNDQGLEGTRRSIYAKMQALGLDPVRHDIPDGNALISGHIGNEHADLLFYNHYDVVEPGKYENWSTADPFDVQIADDKLIGRGVSDNKGALFSRLHAVQAMQATGGLPPLGIKFLTEGDEETSSPSMSRFARLHADTFGRLTEADVCIWENGRNDKDGHSWFRMGVRGSTAFDLRVTTAATDVHGSMGSTVPSASWRLVWALASLKTPDERIAIDGFYDGMLPVTEQDMQVLHDFPYDEADIRSKFGIGNFLDNATGDDLKRRIYTQPSFSICALSAGEPQNGVRGIVPHTAYARISFYLVADQDPSKLRDLLRRHFDKHGFPDVEIEEKDVPSRPVRTPVDIPFRSRAMAAAAFAYEKPMVVELTQLGGGPADILRGAHPTLPIVSFGPGNTTGNHHAPDENLKIEDYRRAIKHLIALFCSYAP